MTYNDKSITFSGDLADYDYNAILRDKQRNIVKLFELSDYFTDADPIYRGIIKGVYTPFALHSPYRLVGASEKTKDKYEEYYDRIHLHDRMRSIYYQYFKYGNAYIYLMEDGTLITLPVHLVRIANVMICGEPVIEFNCKSIRDDMKQQGTKARKDFLEDEDLLVRLEGFPPEVADAIQSKADWVQLNPDNTFVLQELKEDWTRYAVPMVATCLNAFARKALISKYESALLNLGIRSFIHVTYGDQKNDILPDIVQLNQVNSLFRKAMTGGALATTNHLCEAHVIQPDTREMFDKEKYREVNAEILAAGGISGIIVSGRAEDGSNFASAQVSIQTAAMRIKQAQDNFAEMMNKINIRLNGAKGGVTHSVPANVPAFVYPPVDLSGSTKFQETCFKLWQSGVLSTETMLQTHGYDIDQEVERKKQEAQTGVPGAPVQTKGQPANDPANEDKGPGRPEMDDTERNSDKGNSMTGKQPKPSNPDGSL
jgi:hypothetical protein